MPLDREEDWQNIFQSSFAQARSGIYEGRIEPIALSPIFDKSILRVLARSPTAKRTWRLAGTLSQEIGLGMEYQNWKVRLNTKSIIRVDFSSKYRLRFDSVPWLQNLILQIDVYTGIYENTQQQLQEINLKLNQVSEVSNDTFEDLEEVNQELDRLIEIIEN